MKTVGTLEGRLSFWQRFDRMQRTAGKVMGGLPYAKGVYRFHSLQEQDEWQMKQIILRKHRAPRKSTT